MGSSCPLAVPVLSQSKSTNFRGVTLDLHKSAEIAVAVWKINWCGATWRVVALYCTVGITCPKGERQSPRGITAPQHTGDPMVTDAYATLLLAWLEKGCQDGDGPLPPQAGWRVLGHTQSLMETREMQRVLWNSAHHCSYYPTVCGGQLGWSSAQRHGMCPILCKMKLSPLSVTAKPFEGAASTE